MKKYKNRIKNNLIYYWSVVDLTMAEFVCHIIHFCKTGRLPQKRTKCSQEEIQEELKKIAKETEIKEKETPVEGPGSGE